MRFLITNFILPLFSGILFGLGLEQKNKKIIITGIIIFIICLILGMMNVFINHS